MGRRQFLSLTLLAVLLSLAAVAAYRAWERVGSFRASEAVCEAVDARQWGRALELGLPADPSSGAGLRAAECRCVALLQSGRGEECVSLLEELVTAPASEGWLPNPLFTAMVVEARKARGELVGAAHLARLGSERYPDHLILLHQQIFLRRQLGEEGALVADLRRLLPRSGAAQELLRLRVAELHLARNEWDQALEALGPAPPSDESAAEEWYWASTRALGGAGRAEDLLEVVSRWRRVDGDDPTPEAVYAYLLSIFQLLDPLGRDHAELLAKAVERVDELDNAALAESLYHRLVGTLSVNAQHELALRYFDQAVERFGSLGPLQREDILRSASQFLVGEDQLLTMRGALRLEIPGARTGDRLWVSPDPGEAVDEPFREVAIPAGGVVLLERGMGTWPQRWVLEDATGQLRGAGTVWPNPRAPEVVRVERRPPLPRTPAFALDRDAAQGRSSAGDRRRLYVVILDCADWRFVEYGRALERLPVLEALIAVGYRAVLESYPPLTAVAMQALLHPDQRGVEGVLGVLHQLGTEIEGLNFVGRNPLEGLSWLLPGGSDLFTTLGSGELRAVNMLHTHGAVRTGRHGQVSGPFGARGEVDVRSTHRALDSEERSLVEPLYELGYDKLLEEMAADFDAVAALTADPAIDLVVLRVASLDLLTHGTFPAAVRTGQDDGELPLLGAYRYIDRRLGELWRRLDGNDALIVMSDHGIRTALEHDPRALFVAAGAGVAPGRAPGMPELRGFGRTVADFFGVESGWPATGIEPWQGRAATAQASP
jgi:tetratricopeptide (TPR) repeat protein